MKRRLLELGLLAAALAAGVAVAAFPVTQAEDTGSTVLLVWPKQENAEGFVFYRDGQRVSRTFDGSRTSVRFAKGGQYKVVPIVEAAGAVYPPVATPPPGTTTETQPTAPAPSVSVPAYRITTLTGQTSEGPYTFGWVKTKRPADGVNPHWQEEGLIRFADYPDRFVMVESKRFVTGYPGRTTNFHLVGGDEVHNGVSPLSADYHAGRARDWPADIEVGLVLTNEAELDDGRRGHWQLLTDAEIKADRSVVWTLVWTIRWRQDRSGSVEVGIWRDTTLLRTVAVTGVKTAYAEQQPMVYAWTGAYDSTGKIGGLLEQTLEQRGRTLAEALADRPVFGSEEHSTGPQGSSSVVGGVTLTRPRL